MHWQHILSVVPAYVKPFPATDVVLCLQNQPQVTDLYMYPGIYIYNALFSLSFCSFYAKKTTVTFASRTLYEAKQDKSAER